ncbi:MAG: Fic family protein [Dysgonamonadaceae bacterium]|jgi:fido (protein-threonine AMPylation protein)|nr:Fic family protein [Dysgonamonadaceae bacterium]
MMPSTQHIPSSFHHFDEYIRQVEPGKKEKGEIWQTAIGLQQVDGLKPSEYLIQTAIENIEGDITFEEVKNRIDAYYKSQSVKNGEDNNRTEEADKVSARIAEILSEKTFLFSPDEYQNIHRRLFTGIYKFAGKIRDYNITKGEWVLDGDTVLYAPAETLKTAIKYDIEQEREFNFKGLSQQQIIEHLANFTVYLWQIHPFGEGNTRTTAVFLIKYLHKLGYKNISNELFAQHSWYFRNTLVRANYKNLQKNIVATNKYVVRFLENLMLGENNILKNRELHIDFVPNSGEIDTVKATNDTVCDTVKIKNDTANDVVLELINENKSITAEEIRIKLNIGIATAKRRIKKLKDAGIISRIGSDKTGHWQIN